MVTPVPVERVEMVLERVMEPVLVPQVQYREVIRRVPKVTARSVGSTPELTTASIRATTRTG